MEVDVEKGLVLLSLILVLCAQANYFWKDPNVEAVVLGLKIDFLPRFAKLLDLFLDLLDAFDDSAQLIARNPTRFAHGLLLVNVTAQIRLFAQLHQHEPANVVSNVLTGISGSARL